MYIIIDTTIHFLCWTSGLHKFKNPWSLCTPNENVYVEFPLRIFPTTFFQYEFYVCVLLRNVELSTPICIRIQTNTWKRFRTRILKFMKDCIGVSREIYFVKTLCARVMYARLKENSFFDVIERNTVKWLITSKLIWFSQCIHI